MWWSIDDSTTCAADPHPARCARRPPLFKGRYRPSARQPLRQARDCDPHGAVGLGDHAQGFRVVLDAASRRSVTAASTCTPCPPGGNPSSPPRWSCARSPGTATGRCARSRRARLQIRHGRARGRAEQPERRLGLHVERDVGEAQHLLRGSSTGLPHTWTCLRAEAEPAFLFLRLDPQRDEQPIAGRRDIARWIVTSTAPLSSSGNVFPLSCARPACSPR